MTGFCGGHKPINKDRLEGRWSLASGAPWGGGLLPVCVQTARLVSYPRLVSYLPLFSKLGFLPQFSLLPS